MTDRGVLYWNSGTKLLTRLYVSLGSLREIYDGPITLLLSNIPEEFVDILKKHDFNTKVIDVPQGHKQALLIKAKLNEYTPYDTTVFIDCDTIILKPFDELFEWAEEHKFVVTAFSTWNVKRGAIARRVAAWYKHKVVNQEQFNAAVEYPAGINIGVMAFQKDASIYQEWYDLAERGLNVFIPDEVSCQILLPKHQHFLAPPEFNSSCRYSPVTDDTRIIHYHGRKHCRLRRTQRVDEIGTARYWIAKYKQLLKKNWCDIQTVAEMWPDRTLTDLDQIDIDGNLVSIEEKKPLEFPFEFSKLAPSVAELEWLHNYLSEMNDSINSVLEFGCGITTWVINDALEASKYMAIEEFEQCIKDVNTHVPSVKISNNWDSFKGETFDLVFVDSSAGCGMKGLNRDKALIASLPCLSEESIVIIHDWRKRSGKAPRKYLEDAGWDLIAKCEIKSGLGVYRMPKGGIKLTGKFQKTDGPSHPGKVYPIKPESRPQEPEPEDAPEPEEMPEAVGAESIRQAEDERILSNLDKIAKSNGTPFDYSKITVVTACDVNHLPRLNATLPTWVRLKKLTCPIIVFMHGVKLDDPSLNLIKEYDNVRFVDWDQPGAETQRERMLSAFVLGVAKEVKTEFWLKLDSDTVATNANSFMKDGFFEYDMIGHKWGYTKPGTMVPKIDYWMDGLDKLGKLEKYDFKGAEKKYKIDGDLDNPKKTKFISKRVISCIRLMKTSVTQEIASNVIFGRLPVFSEDTLVWRWCERLDLKWGRHNFKKAGWAHTKKDLDALAKAALLKGSTTNISSMTVSTPVASSTVHTVTSTEEEPEVEAISEKAEAAVSFCKLFTPKKPFRKWTVTPDEWVFLNELTMNKKSKNILEIGSFIYTSSLAFLKAMIELKDTYLTSIDPTHGEFSTNDKSLDKRWFRITGNSEDILPRLQKKTYDLIFIDGVHTAEAVKNDFKNSLELLIEDGLIVFHDINNREVRNGMLSVFDEDIFHWINRNEQSNSKGIAVFYDNPQDNPSGPKETT